MTFGNVAAERAAIEMTYDGLCTVTEFQQVMDPVTKVTKERPVKVMENQPCALSQASLPSARQTDTDNTIDYEAKLFISPDVTIKAGCLITVIQDGMTFNGEQAGKPFRYATHQEVKLKEIGKA